MLKAMSEEDNVMVELPTLVIDNQITDIIEIETSEREETVPLLHKSSSRRFEIKLKDD